MRVLVLQLLSWYLLCAIAIGVLRYWDLHWDGYFDQVGYYVHTFRAGMPSGLQVLLGGFLRWEAIVMALLLTLVAGLLKGYARPPFWLFVILLCVCFCKLLFSLFVFTLARGLFPVPDEVLLAALLFLAPGIFVLRRMYYPKPKRLE